MAVPKYRKHSSGQARVTIRGKDFLLGPYDSPESKAEYHRIISEYLASGCSRNFRENPHAITMAMLCVDFIHHAEKYYGKTTELKNFKLAIRPIATLYPDHLVSNFGPLEYKACRSWWMQGDRSRQYINAQMKRLLAVIKWGTGEGMVPAGIYQTLRCVPHLRKGRTEAREAEAIKPVQEDVVSATIPFLDPIVADMVRLQQLSGCRPCEICSLRPSMIEKLDGVWVARLDDHKTAHHGKSRSIYFGPKSQAILKKYFDRSADRNFFSPREISRKRGVKPRSSVRDYFVTHSYAQCIRRACEKAKIEVWGPNRLRHSKATQIRKEHGIEAASVTLGHSNLNTTEVYAERNEKLAIQIAKSF